MFFPITDLAVEPVVVVVESELLDEEVRWSSLKIESGLEEPPPWSSIDMGWGSRSDSVRW